MSTITVLRPSATTSGVDWSAQPSGTLHGVTSDDNDSTYALWGGAGSPMILATPIDSPPVGERRHLVRLRARGEDGDAWWAVRLSSGVLVASAAGQFGASPETISGSWGAGAPADGSTVLYAYVAGQSTGLRITELYLDVDTREEPTFDPEILDGSGTPSVVISDTSQPIVRADNIDLDGLAPRQYRYWVTQGATIVWDTGIVSGSAVNRQTDPLDNGTYTAHLQVWSTLGVNTTNPSAEETIDFTLSVGLVPQPDNPIVTPQPDSPLYDIEVCAPYTGDFDDGEAWIEIQRVDCPIGGYLSLPGVVGAYASTPDPGPALTDLEITVVAGRDDGWLLPAEETLAAHYETVGDQRSWRISLNSGLSALQPPFLGWSEDGTSALEFSTATERPPIDPYGVVRLRVRLDVDNGAGGWEVTWETRLSDTEDWAQLGDVIVGGSTSSLFDSNAPYTAGAYLTGGVSNGMFTGRIYSLQVREGAAGPIIVNPDFTGHLNGTREFEDAAGNTWTVNGSASIYSPTSIVTIAMVGPLETGECETWTDYSIPRTSMGATCDHQPIECCSYYRARTVGRIDGDLRVSDWSDGFDPGVPNGAVVMWPDTDASIPDGWDRVTALDSRYPKGIASAVTEPGTTGGATLHTHTTPGHTHDTSHSHGTGANTAAATGTVNTANTAGALVSLATHTHSRPSTASATVVSGSSSPGVDNENNDPARLDVIFIESNGLPEGVPDGALAMHLDTSVSGWTDYANATNRFLKGAVAAGDGGATAASSLNAHLHTVFGHTHTGTAHIHTSANTGAASSTTLNPAAGPNSVTSAAAHTHPITVASGTTAALASASGGNSGTSGTLDPPYRNLRVKENTSGVPDLPVGLICAWRGSLGSIPNFWQLCDGTNGTPDMLGLYPRGATSSINGTGGSLTAHTHTGGSHTHTGGTHNHTSTTGTATGSASVSATATVSVATSAHTHVLTSTDNANPTVASVGVGTLGSVTQEPPFEEVAFIQLMEEPTPPPEPEAFCLTWSDDEHLIRTTGPDGPMWAPVWGKFDWDVDRPFTAATGVMGSRFVTSAPPGARNLGMVAAVESEAQLATLRAVLSRPLVLISPSDASEVWAAPVAESVKIIKIGRIRQVTASFIGTGPEPAPQLADVGV